jgi:hypothetical protein
MLSICIIGSQARRTADVLSDQDVLLVGAPSKVLDHAMDEWCSGGWNVSVFDRPAFDRLAEVRSLFVQHVKQEGLIVRDDGSFLSATLQSYVPKTDYLGERNDALRQIAALPWQNGHYWHDLCLADITYVLFRNAAILHLASAGLYCFGYDLLMECVAGEFGLSLRDLRALTGLRRLKHAYRQRITDVEVAGRVDGVRRIIAGIVARLRSLDASGIAAGLTTEDYFSQRLLELGLAWRFTPPALDMIGPDHDLFPLWRSLTTSSGYPKVRASRLH